MTNVGFGWRSPDFPVDGSSARAFRQQFFDTLDQIQDHYDTVWVADHFVPWAHFQAIDTPTVEAISTIAYLAGAYPNLKIGSIVLAQSYRNPALLAKTTANIQYLSGGRFILGIGAGWKDDEYLAYGYEFPRPAVRIQQLDESVQIIRRLWSGGPVTWEGKHYRIENAYCEPRPDPAPPIMIGGGGEQLTLRVVAKHADWWNIPGGTVESYAHKLEVLKEHCRAVGRDYDTIRKTWSVEVVAIADTEQEAQRLAHASPFYNGIGIAGTPEQAVEQLEAYTRLGCDYFMVRFAEFPRTECALRIATQVAPHVRRAAAG
jgi:alkanesulfonate monooxygenase SsuD/methylene tetrahydromethanopterin reductase-like flavin-dependent oxidoreductase (luciferase family)